MSSFSKKSLLEEIYKETYYQKEHKINTSQFHQGLLGYFWFWLVAHNHLRGKISQI